MNEAGQDGASQKNVQVPPTPPQYQTQQYQQNYQPPNPSTGNHGVQKEPFYKRTWFVVLLMILVPPVGILLAWVLKKPTNQTARIILTVVSVLILIAAFMPKDDSTSQSSTNTQQSEAAPSQQREEVQATPEKEVDKSLLKASIDQFSALDPAAYTPESFAAMTTALTDAQAVYDDADATEAEVTKANSALSTASNGLEEVFNPANYASIPYIDLARNPDSYAGSKIAITGKVLQVSEGSSEINLRVATDMAYDDVVFIGYDPNLMASRVLEDDIVTIYGTCVGLYSYTSTLGATISLPGLYADQIEIQ